MTMPRRERGVALVTALLIVSLATVTAVSFAMQQQFDIRRTGNLIDGGQAWEYAKGGEEWAKLILRRDRNPEIDALTEAWAQPLPPIDLPGGYMVGHITDAQARFNINNLVQEGNPGNAGNDAQQQFQRLLMSLGLDPRLIWPIIDWMDRNINPVSAAGAEDDFYSGLKHPYRTANQPMTSISELRLVKGFNDKIYRRLAPFLTALPTAAPTLINVNTAPAEVLIMLAPGMDLEGAAALIKLRQGNPFKDAAGFTDAVQTVAGITLTNIETLVGINTQFFEIRVETRIGYGRAELNSLLVREGNEIKVIRRTQGF